jgi:hypothetical protein
MGASNSDERVQVNTKLLDSGIAIAIVGMFLVVTGALLGGSSFWYAGRRWLRNLEKAPSDSVKHFFEHVGTAATAGAKAASEAGSKAWNEGSAAA